MKDNKVLFIAQEITPYVPATPFSIKGRDIPHAIQELGNEIRTFLPKWGNINERRNQLHEVIRLSGLNIIIDDTDHPLIIKVASLQPQHIQVYFIDNEDLFQKRLMEVDKNGEEYDDNYIRAIFYARSVLETVKKLRWYPRFIHCQGWMASLAPFYIRTAFKDEPAFANTKIIYSLHNVNVEKPLPANFRDCIAYRQVALDTVNQYQHPLQTPQDLLKMGIAYSDAVIAGDEHVDDDYFNFARELNIPILDYKDGQSEAERLEEYFQSFA